MSNSKEILILAECNQCFNSFESDGREYCLQCLPSNIPIGDIVFDKELGWRRLRKQYTSAFLSYKYGIRNFYHAVFNNHSPPLVKVLYYVQNNSK